MLGNKSKSRRPDDYGPSSPSYSRSLSATKRLREVYCNVLITGGFALFFAGNCANLGQNFRVKPLKWVCIQCAH